jgi:hypothetical protein
MLFKKRWCKYFLLFVVSGVLITSGAQAKSLTQSFSLGQSDDTLPSIQIPFQITVAGAITVKIKFDSSDRQNEKMFLVSLYRVNTPYPLASRYYKPGSTGLYLRHEVSRKEFAVGTNYYLTLTSYSLDKSFIGEVQLSYPVPGETEVTFAGKPLPNLAIKNIYLDKHCKVVVALENLGPGQLPLYFWKRNMPVLTLTKDGILWGEADIRFFDYGKALNSVGGESIYGSGLKIVKSARIRVEIDVNRRVKEGDETDNSREVDLICK